MCRASTLKNTRRTRISKAKPKTKGRTTTKTNQSRTKLKSKKKMPQKSKRNQFKNLQHMKKFLSK